MSVSRLPWKANQQSKFGLGLIANLLTLLAATGLAADDPQETPIAELIQRDPAEAGHELLKFARPSKPLTSPARNAAWAPAFSPNGKRLLVGYGHYNTPGEVRVWNGRTLVSAGLDRSIRVWRATVPPRPPLRTLREKADLSLVSPDNRWLLIAGGSAPSAKLYDLKTGDLARRLGDHAGGIVDAAFSPDGRSLATTGENRMIRLWSVETGRPMENGSRRDESVVQSVDFSPKGDRLAAGGDAKTVAIYELNAAGFAGKRVETSPQKLPITAVTFSPRGDRFATSTGDENNWRSAGEVKLWDARTGKELKTLGRHAAKVNGLKFSPDGKRLVSYGYFGFVRVWELASGRDVVALRVEKNATAVAFLPGGDQLAVAEYGGSLNIWNLSTGTCTARYTGHKSTITSLSASADGSLLATASQDGAVSLWPTRASGHTR